MDLFDDMVRISLAATESTQQISCFFISKVCCIAHIHHGMDVGVSGWRTVGYELAELVLGALLLCGVKVRRRLGLRSGRAIFGCSA